MNTEQSVDVVAHPKHYTTGKIEVIEYIEDQKLNFSLGNAIKYISRAGKKYPEKHIEDLKKAAWYVQREIETLEAAKAGREPVRPNDMGKNTTMCRIDNGQLMALCKCGGVRPYGQIDDFSVIGKWQIVDCIGGPQVLAFVPARSVMTDEALSRLKLQHMNLIVIPGKEFEVEQ